MKIISKKFMMILKKLVLIIIGMIIFGVHLPTAFSETAKTEKHSRKATVVELTKLSIEELLNTQVISVSKKPQKISEVAAAIYVITNENIRRSGVTTVAQALRMAPGVQVARIDSNEWAISVRGFNGRFSNKLLVLVDGRSVYVPYFSGVLWEILDTHLEDIERIEIIRGPGASLWGANAVNGVINIITKSSKDTKGTLISTRKGNIERGYGSVRYGGKAGQNAHYRIYAKYNQLENETEESISKEYEDRKSFQTGFRMDWNFSTKDTLIMQGDFHNSSFYDSISIYSMAPFHSKEIAAAKDKKQALNIMSKWQHKVSDSSETELKFYYDRYKFNHTVFGIEWETIDLDFQHRFKLGDFHEIMWGTGFCFISDKAENNIHQAWPESRDTQLYSGFVQDEISLVKNKVILTLGSKFEYNDYTGFEFQPNARLLWKAKSNHSFWASVSRAVRTPSRSEHDGSIIIDSIQPIPANALFPGSPELPGSTISYAGDRSFESEELIAYELGYRVQVTNTFLADTALFFNEYKKLRSFEPSEWLTPAQQIPIELKAYNKARAESYGMEIALDWYLWIGYVFSLLIVICK